MTLDLILFTDATEFLFSLILHDVEAAGQPSASRVIKTLRAEQPLLGGWQWFNEIRALTQHSQLQTHHRRLFRTHSSSPASCLHPAIYQEILLRRLVLLAIAGH